MRLSQSDECSLFFRNEEISEEFDKFQSSQFFETIKHKVKVGGPSAILSIYGETSFYGENKTKEELEEIHLPGINLEEYRVIYSKIFCTYFKGFFSRDVCQVIVGHEHDKNGFCFLRNCVIFKECIKNTINPGSFVVDNLKLNLFKDVKFYFLVLKSEFNGVIKYCNRDDIDFFYFDDSKKDVEFFLKQAVQNSQDFIKASKNASFTEKKKNNKEIAQKDKEIIKNDQHFVSKKRTLLESITIQKEKNSIRNIEEEMDSNSKDDFMEEEKDTEEDKEKGKEKNNNEGIDELNDVDENHFENPDNPKSEPNCSPISNELSKNNDKNESQLSKTQSRIKKEKNIDYFDKVEETIKEKVKKEEREKEKELKKTFNSKNTKKSESFLSKNKAPCISTTFNKSISKNIDKQKKYYQAFNWVQNEEIFKTYPLIYKWFQNNCLSNENAVKKALLLYSDLPFLGKSQFAQNLVNDSRYALIFKNKINKPNLNKGFQPKLAIFINIDSIPLGEEEDHFLSLITGQRALMTIDSKKEFWEFEIPCILTTRSFTLLTQLYNNIKFRKNIVFIEIKEYIGIPGKQYHCIDPDCNASFSNDTWEKIQSKRDLQKFIKKKGHDKSDDGDIKANVISFPFKK